jgi:signal transduction histidine kinase
VVEDGIPPGWIICLLVDHSGRLWIGSQLGGLNRIDDTTSDALSVARYTTANGLSSDNIRSLTEDQWGRIYLGTGHGVDRLSLETGNVKHYTIADGLVKGKIEVALRDHENNLWFGSWFGLSRFVPEQVDSGAPPSIYVTSVRVSGNPRAEFQLGVTNSPRLELSSSENNVSIDFVGLGSSIGEELGYQYRLQGASSDWSAPSSERTINFANLAAGLYQFEVRARNADGLLSLNPSTLEFEIAAPVWRRWWFLSLMVALMGLAIYSVYRSRLGRLLELERIRTRIATDLHDDVGSGLSQVSILSEVISRRVGQEQGVVEQLSIIGSVSRDLVDSMSDIVWAINPGRDRLSDLSHRMRRFASDVLIAHGVEFSFDIPHPGRDIRLGPEMRRELYLIFKEAVNNIVRHSDCTEVKITFLISDGALELSVHDNGDGFESESENEGNGLVNMRLRAAKLGGDLRITSNNGHGTTVLLKAPLGRRRWFRLNSRRNRN